MTKQDQVMAAAIIDDIYTHYEVTGSGPPLLLFAPGGFDATIEKWSTLGTYAKTKPLHHLATSFTCIAFDRRECGRSGGRVERVTWMDFARQAKGLLDHLGFQRASIMGGCMGCSAALAFALAYPEATDKMVLFWPVGGAKYRINSHQRFAEHLSFVVHNGMEAVVKLVEAGGKPFGGDPRGGPWASVIKSDPAFAAQYAAMNVDVYKLIVAGMVRTMMDRDTAPGAEAEDLLRCQAPALVAPGNDASHATSAARYLAECLPGAQYWDMPVDGQTEQSTTKRLLDFLSA
jgi:pimeloyl-ACP methyl ester carboxylesterase